MITIKKVSCTRWCKSLDVRDRIGVKTRIIGECKDSTCERSNVEPDRNCGESENANCATSPVYQVSIQVWAKHSMIWDNVNHAQHRRCRCIEPDRPTLIHIHGSSYHQSFSFHQRDGRQESPEASLVDGLAGPGTENHTGCKTAVKWWGSHTCERSPLRHDAGAGKYVTVGLTPNQTCKRWTTKRKHDALRIKATWR